VSSIPMAFRVIGDISMVQVFKSSPRRTRAFVVSAILGLCAGLIPELLVLLDARMSVGHFLPYRCPLLGGVQATIESDDSWSVVSRCEHPREGGWSLVASHGDASDSDRIPASSIMIFESIPGTSGFTVSHRSSGQAHQKSLGVSDLGSSSFVRRLRGDLGYEISACPAESSREAIRVVQMILADRVRELRQPDLLLTSGLSQAD